MGQLYIEICTEAATGRHFAEIHDPTTGSVLLTGPPCSSIEAAQSVVARDALAMAEQLLHVVRQGFRSVPRTEQT